MRLLLTGATGFVGSALRCSPRVRSWEVIPAVRRRSGLHAEVIVGEIDAHTDWRTALHGCDTVVHLASRVHVMRDFEADPFAAFKAVNTDGTLNLARQAAAAGVQRFVFISSIKVNGECSAPGIAFRADDNPAPRGPYAISKLEAERGLLALATECNIEVVILRAPLVYGPGAKGNFASMVRWLKSGIPLPLAGVRNRRSLLAIDNLVDFVVLCADRGRSPAAANRVFLVSDGDAVSTPDLLRRIAAIHGCSARLFAAPPWLLRLAAGVIGKSSALDRLVGDLTIDIDQSVSVLAWRPVVTLEQQFAAVD